MFGHLPLVLVSGPGAEARNSIGTVHVTGMTIGTIFTLFVVPVFYSFIAATHRPEEPPTEAELERPEEDPLLGLEGDGRGHPQRSVGWERTLERV